MNCNAVALMYFAAAMVFAVAVSADEDGGLTSSPSAVFKKVSSNSRHHVVKRSSNSKHTLIFNKN